MAWVSGAAFLIRHDQFDTAGGFDEKFSLYEEEVDLCRRLRRCGRRIIYDPHISLIHYGGAVAKKRKYSPPKTKHVFSASM